MIIRATVHDNDFEWVLNSFFRNFLKRFLEFSEEEIQENPAAVHKKLQQLSYLINPNNGLEYTEEQKQVILDRVKELFYAYVDRSVRDSANYLKEKFDVTIVDSMTDKWENGEVCYWFQHSDTYLIQ